DFLMIGDDIESDITGAQAMGGKGILIYTGKTKYPLRDDIKIKPNYEAQNLTEVIEKIKDQL
ncbi:MAG: HAD hydrolase-like protein, partial [Bacteroidetes bacterium]|nr:HAD hydrolase-like protein [Bacteroidota bacterium]